MLKSTGLVSLDDGCTSCLPTPANTRERIRWLFVSRTNAEGPPPERVTHLRSLDRNHLAAPRKDLRLGPFERRFPLLWRVGASIALRATASLSWKHHFAAIAEPAYPPPTNVRRGHTTSSSGERMPGNQFPKRVWGRSASAVSTPTHASSAPALPGTSGSCDSSWTESSVELGEIRGRAQRGCSGIAGVALPHHTARLLQRSHARSANFCVAENRVVKQRRAESA